MSKLRIGHGYDVHALAPGDGIVMGGLTIPCDFSLVAHSDGDVLIHALCDAILGALGRGDIGQRFPDNSEQHRDQDSREFLRDCQLLCEQDGYQLVNADVTIIAQQPKMAKHTAGMKGLLAADLKTEAAVINIKATTTEGLGYIGRAEGIAVHAVVLLEGVA